MYKCSYCNRECKSTNALTQHGIRCNNNPLKINTTVTWDTKRKGRPGVNQYIKARRLGLPDPVMSLEQRKQISENNKKRVWSIEQRKKHSVSMKQAVQNNPESYTSSNRGRTKSIEINGIKFQGQWEVDFYSWCIDNKIKIERNIQTFPYTWNGIRSYIPDFYLPELDAYVEVKGYETDRDRAKWLTFPKKLIIIKAEEIKNIRKGCFLGFN